MIMYKTGDLFTEDVEAIINTVNCVGVMGAGLALQFKNRYPDNYKAYKEACKRNEVVPGKMFVYSLDGDNTPKYIVNFPTKRHWKNPSYLEDIETGLEDLVQVIQQRGIKSIAVPALGAGLGGLDWNEVREQIEKYLGPLEDVKVVVFNPL